MNSTPPASSRSPDFQSTQELLRTILQSSRICLQQVERLKGVLNRVYLVRLADGRAYVMKCPPYRSTPLLRQERHGMQDESRILKLMATAPDVPIPRIVHCREHGGSFGPYLLRTFIPGTRLTEMAPYLTASERETIDRTLGRHMERITSSTAGTFGTSAPVFAGEGHSNWQKAFHHLLESTLRDAEDMLVSVPYESIRSHFEKHGHLLRLITTSQLVPMQAGLPENVIIDQHTKQVSGIIGFSDTIWGDPMISPVLAQASPAFWKGYGKYPSPSEGERTRQLMYTMYRALVQIVTNYYRPSEDDLELEARRLLTWSLNQLDAI
ncbi:hypothetical protein EJ05DRAFT_439483 [Pseudovirgaria hyperparasitica]|uniref:Aminoglycoside phosphotransferase domain-containing protein n=1 Tax=Pseudovirgaria hyperparasitica TaxID=470096 RepID=A0A6A6WAQ5_9PEZI|nr:uncharacterized protein EJ05DRAFT_439483 [Pseudovirgaria hyperparasitica]KAF2758201.1 hypothetical protein EJ05DRAFT_439483 [Pseudovirgaria hyperparasitica]